MTEQAKREEVLNYIKDLEEELTDFISDKFGELEIGVDLLGIRNMHHISLIFDNIDIKTKSIIGDLRRLRQSIIKLPTT